MIVHLSQVHCPNLHAFVGVCDEEGAVRLDYGGNVDLDKGRLEVCASGKWGTVCGDGYSGSSGGFDISAARVVCRQLGVVDNGELFIMCHDDCLCSINLSYKTRDDVHVL